MKSLLPTMIIVASTLSSLASAEVDNTSAIKAVDSAWSRLLNMGKTEKLVHLYTSNAVVMPPSSEILTDTAAIKGYWDALRETGVTAFEIYDVNLHIEGDKAYQTALWSATRQSGDDVFEFEGNMSNILKRQKDGNWKIMMQSWN